MFDNNVINLCCGRLPLFISHMSNDRLEPFNYHNIAFKRCADVSLGRLDHLWFFRHHCFVKIGWLGKKWGSRHWTELLAFWDVWNRSRSLIFGPDQLFSGFPEPRWHPYFQLSANQITWSRLLIQIHLMNDKQYRSRSADFFRSQLIWRYTLQRHDTSGFSKKINPCPAE